MSHWYDTDGNPRYTVPYANGKGERDTNLTDARKLGLSPSVTTVLGLVDKPALTIWKMNQLFQTMVDYPPYDIKSEEHLATYKKLIMGRAAKAGKDAADRGTEIHDALDIYYKIKYINPDFKEFINPVVKLLDAKFGNIEWVPEMSFTHPDRFGGKCDLHAKPCEAFPNGVILDFKTKATENFKGVKAYDEHCMQLVAYREGFNVPKAECFNLFISTHTPGELMLHGWSEENCQKAWTMFKCLLQYYLTANKLGN